MERRRAMEVRGAALKRKKRKLVNCWRSVSTNGVGEYGLWTARLLALSSADQALLLNNSQFRKVRIATDKSLGQEVCEERSCCLAGFVLSPPGFVLVRAKVCARQGKSIILYCAGGA